MKMFNEYELATYELDDIQYSLTVSPATTYDECMNEDDEAQLATDIVAALSMVTSLMMEYYDRVGHGYEGFENEVFCWQQEYKNYVENKAE